MQGRSLAEADPALIRREETGAAPTRFCVGMAHAVGVMQNQLIEKTVLDRHGLVGARGLARAPGRAPPCLCLAWARPGRAYAGLRIFRLLMDKKQLEQKQIADLAVLPPKDAREALYSLFQDGFVALQARARTCHRPRVPHEAAPANANRPGRRMSPSCQTMPPRARSSPGSSTAPQWLPAWCATGCALPATSVRASTRCSSSMPRRASCRCKRSARSCCAPAPLQPIGRRAQVLNLLVGPGAEAAGKQLTPAQRGAVVRYRRARLIGEGRFIALAPVLALFMD